MTERSLHFTAKGFKSQVVAIADDTINPKSKRYGIIDKEDQNLNKNLCVLEEGTKARNRIFQKRIDEVWDASEIWESKLRTEAREAVESITNLREEYEKHFENFNFSLQAELKTAFDHFDNEMIPEQILRHKKVEEDLTFFVEKIAPVEIDKTSGDVRRRLKKVFEDFYIGQQKEKIRELKFVKKTNQHIQLCAQRLTDEDALTAACFYNLEDDVIETERRSIRMHLLRWNGGVKNVISVKEVLRSESDLRLVEDSILLDTVIESQQLLQHTVLEHFGQEDEKPKSQKEPVLFPVHEKLNERMSRRTSRKSGKESEKTKEIA